jgi:hypothetical protein
MQFIQAINALLVEKAAAAALAAPAVAGDGIDISSWKNKHVTPIGYSLAAVAIYADGIGTIDNPALYAYGPYGAAGANKWLFVAYLNNRIQIALTAAVGFVQQIELPTVFTRLAVGGVVAGGVNFGYTATPIAVHGGAS